MVSEWRPQGGVWERCPHMINKEVSRRGHSLLPPTLPFCHGRICCLKLWKPSCDHKGKTKGTLQTWSKALTWWNYWMNQPWNQLSLDFVLHEKVKIPYCWSYRGRSKSDSDPDVVLPWHPVLSPQITLVTLNGYQSSLDCKSCRAGTPSVLFIAALPRRA